MVLGLQLFLSAREVLGVFSKELSCLLKIVLAAVWKIDFRSV